MTDETAPTLGPIHRATGVAGSMAYAVTVTYANGDTVTITFVGNLYGGPVTMFGPATPEGTYVTEPERFGDFSEEWVRRFFA